MTDLKVNTEIGIGIDKEVRIKTFMMHNDNKIILSSTSLFKLVDNYLKNGMPYEIVSNDILFPHVDNTVSRISFMISSTIG